MTAELSLVVAMGLLGSAHCIGMCGGFVILAHSRRGFVGTLSWLGGKVVTYALLGAIAGGVGHLVSGVSGTQFVLTIVVGLLLILLGLGTAGVIPDRLPVVGGLGKVVGRTLGRVYRTEGPSGPFVMGMVGGLLPCGLVYAAMAHATSTGTIPEGALVMTAFGLATFPSLTFTAWVSGRVGPVVMRRIARLGGWLVVLLGLVTLWRAWMSFGGHAMHG